MPSALARHPPSPPPRYRARFASVELGAGAQSGSGSNIFYSFSIGLVHFLSFSAESYAYRSGAELLANQLAFMKADLAAVDRKVTPWVVALVHKDWNMEAEAYAAFYPILDSGDVDVLFCGHVRWDSRTRDGKLVARGSWLNPSPFLPMQQIHYCCVLGL